LSYSPPLLPRATTAVVVALGRGGGGGRGEDNCTKGKNVIISQFLQTLIIVMLFCNLTFYKQSSLHSNIAMTITGEKIITWKQRNMETKKRRIDFLLV